MRATPSNGLDDDVRARIEKGSDGSKTVKIITPAYYLASYDS